MGGRHSSPSASSVIEAMAKSLGSSVLKGCVTATVHVKSVSMFMRGERVREERALVLEDWLMMTRSPDIISTPALSCQVKEYKISCCVSTTVRSNRAEHVRVTSSAPPARRGPVDVMSRDTVGTGTVEKWMNSYILINRFSDLL